MDQMLYQVTFTKLYKNGVSELLACLTAYIVATDHLRDSRTAEQQAIVTAAWEQYWGLYPSDRTG